MSGCLALYRSSFVTSKLSCALVLWCSSIRSGVFARLNCPEVLVCASWIRMIVFLLCPSFFVPRATSRAPRPSSAFHASSIKAIDSGIAGRVFLAHARSVVLNKSSLKGLRSGLAKEISWHKKVNTRKADSVLRDRLYLLCVLLLKRLTLFNMKIPFKLNRNLGLKRVLN